MSLHFTTVSGSHYEIRRTPWDYLEVRRVSDSATKRADGEWVRLVGQSAIIEGYPVLLELASLAEHGPDDIGTPKEWANATTRRTTSTVTRTWTEPE